MTIDTLIEKIEALASKAVKDARNEGWQAGHADGYAEAVADEHELSAGIRDDLFDGFRRATDDAHHQARHCGPWQMCSDPMCAAIERWLHFETKEVVSA
jgi:hypothetical protein